MRSKKEIREEIARFAALFLSSLSTENRKDDKDGN